MLYKLSVPSTIKIPNNPYIDSAKTDKTRFRRFRHYANGSFWKSKPETPKQLDAVDEPDAEGALQGHGLSGLRRPRQLRRVDWAFILPGVGRHRKLTHFQRHFSLN